jgi:hypothetical protein
MTSIDFDPRTAKIGDRVPYLDEHEHQDAREAGDEQRILRDRSMCLLDDGSGYLVAWRYAADGSYLDNPIVGAQPATSWEE